MEADGVHIVDTATFTETGFLTTGVAAHGLYPSRDGTKLYIANRGSHRIHGPRRGPGSVTVMDFATEKIVANWKVPGGGSPDMVSAEQLGGERPLQRAMAANVRHDELTLEDLMTPLSDWAIIDAGELAHARVGDIVETLHATGQRYLFVTEKLEDDEVALRGLFSARRIEEALEAAIDSDGHAHSFAELGSLLAR